MLCLVVSDRGSIQQLLNAELAGVLLVLGGNLVVVAADGLVVDNQAGTAKFRQNTVSQLLEGMAHVLDLLLTLLRVLIHGKHAENHLLVLNVGGGYQFLETFPVLGGVAGLNLTLHLGLLHLLLDIAFGILLTLVGQLLVQVKATIGRSVGRNLDIVEV